MTSAPSSPSPTLKLSITMPLSGKMQRSSNNHQATMQLPATMRSSSQKQCNYQAATQSPPTTTNNRSELPPWKKSLFPFRTLRNLWPLALAKISDARNAVKRLWLRRILFVAVRCPSRFYSHRSTNNQTSLATSATYHLSTLC